MQLQLVVAFRIANALLVQSQFDPDEFWQAGEPAHLLVFGNGHLTWEWSANVALRSWIHPLLLTIPMWLLKITGWDSPITMLMLPRIFLQVPLLVWCDWSVCEMAKRLGGKEKSYSAWMLTLTNWFMFYCGVRTYSNSFEACVVMGILNLWQHNMAPSTLVLVLAALCITIRPTSAISFTVLGLWYASQELHNREFWRDAVCRILPTLLLCLACCAMVDSWMYGKPVFVLYNFVQFNLVRNIAVLYGTHPWYWYFALCFPALLGIQLPAFVYGIVKISTSAEHVRLVVLILCNLMILSSSAHKELRFALPCVPPALVLASAGLDKLEMSTLNQRRVKALMLFGGAIPALYLALVHQRAAIDVALYLGALPTDSRIDVLLPCHSIPHYAVVHHRMAAFTFLDCTPRLPELRPYHTPHHNETYLFRENPANFLAERYSEAQQLLPTVIVTEAKHIDIVQSYFVQPTLIRFAHGQDNEDIIVVK